MGPMAAQSARDRALLIATHKLRGFRAQPSRRAPALMCARRDNNKNHQAPRMKSTGNSTAKSDFRTDSKQTIFKRSTRCLI